MNPMDSLCGGTRQVLYHLVGMSPHAAVAELR